MSSEGAKAQALGAPEIEHQDFRLQNDREWREKLDHVKRERDEARLENWQLKGALGYPVPADIPEGPYKCGMCDAKWKRAEAAEKRAASLDDEIVRYQKMLDDAWRERDEMRTLMMDSDKVVVAAAALIAYLAARVK